jgi:hypothetical protein
MMYIINKLLLEMRRIGGTLIFLNNILGATLLCKRNKLWKKHFTTISNSVNATSFSYLFHSFTNSCILLFRFAAARIVINV